MTTLESLSELDWLIHGMSTKKEGEMGNFQGAQPNEAWQTNRQTFLDKLQLSSFHAAKLIHGDQIQEVQSGSPATFPDTDGLITRAPNTPIAVTAADCAPVFLVDPVKRAIGLVHSGWRGTEKNIAGKALDQLTPNTESAIAAIGPCIHRCCFEVSKEVAEKFQAYPGSVEKTEDRYYVDLPGVIKQQLTKQGVKNIEIHPDCTCCNPDTYFSYRRDRPEVIETMLAVIAMV